jgi:hypothetical protein
MHMSEARTITGSVDRRQLSELNQELTSARDEQIARVVAMVDALPVRGAADHLIAPLRPRLAHLRPVRPLRFVRLLFTPFDPIIVPGAKWQPGSPSVPRTAFGSIAEVVKAGLGETMLEIDALIAGRTTGDHSIVACAGALLWPQAARILAQADAPPAHWSETGLSDAAYGALVRSAAVVFGQASALHDLVENVTHGAALRPEEVLRILGTSSAEAQTPAAWGMLLAILLSRLPQADAVLRAAVSNGVMGPNSVLRAAADQAIDVILSGLETQGGDGGPIAGSDLAEAGAEVVRILALLQGLDSDRASGARRRRVHELRQRVEQSCRDRFEAGLTAELVAPLMLLRPGASSAEVSRLENVARDLRKLEIAARKLSIRNGLEAQLLRAAEEIGVPNPDNALGLADRVRMVEILAGPDAAMALLDAAI